MGAFTVLAGTAAWNKRWAMKIADIPPGPAKAVRYANDPGGRPGSLSTEAHLPVVQFVIRLFQR